MSDYILSVSSQDKRNEGEEFRVFHVDGEDVIGVEEKEPFELRFKNNTNQTVQVRLSVDGTDVLSGKPASTKPTGEMFLVSPYDSMSLKAWPESMQGGARFVFTTVEKSVAVNTHGNAAGIGLIAAAVYTDYEGWRYSTPIRNTSGRFNSRSKSVPMGSSSRGLSHNLTKGSYESLERADSDSLSMNFCEAAAGSSVSNIADTRNMAVGAGEYADQTLVKAAGLRRPVLDEIVQIRYLPWSKLRSLVKEIEYFGKEAHGAASAFPGDHNPKIDLSNVPRTKSTARKLPEVYRFI